MDATDRLITGFYHASSRRDWRDFRAHGLAELCVHFGAEAGVWRLCGTDGDVGELTQVPKAFIDPAELRALTVADSVAGKGPHTLVGPHGPGYAQVLRNSASGPTSTVMLKFPRGTPLPEPVEVGRAISHLVEAGALALDVFIHRDDWLHAMGRASRGSAALIDVTGCVYAASSAFCNLIQHAGHAPLNGRLPFTLPKDLLSDDGGEFVSGSLHLRLARHGTLFLLHARRPLPLDALSPREQEIARALTDGKTLKTIARQYGIAISTVANHTTRIYRKLAIYRREDLVELIRPKPPKR